MMFLKKKRIQFIFLTLGIVSSAAGSVLLHARNSSGVWFLLFAFLVLGATQFRIYDRLTGGDAGNRVGLLMEISVVVLALAITGWSCFSYLGSLDGFHYDTAEITGAVTERARILEETASPLFRFMMERPHTTVIALIVNEFGFGLWQLRIFGALLCFLTAPLVYLTVRLIFDRTAAALGILLYSGSLWNFTLSKVATWDAAVSFVSILTVFLTLAILKKKRGWLLFPLLLFAIIWGFNIYEAYRLTLPVIAGIAFLGGLFWKRYRIRALVIAAGLGISVFIQSSYVDSLFWERIAGSKLVEMNIHQIFTEFASNLLGGLFYGTRDIYLSPSQNGMDHPLFIGLFLAGFFITLSRIHRFESFIFAVWLIIPSAAALVFEGQWRRASAAMPVIYIYASIPLAAMSRSLMEFFKRDAFKARKIIFGAVSLVAVIIVFLNISRFSDIQQNRSGGYYVMKEELAAARYATELLKRMPVYVFSDSHDVLWNFINRLQGGDGDYFQWESNLLAPFGNTAGKMHEVLSQALESEEHKTAVFMNKEDDMILPYIRRMERVEAGAGDGALRSDFPGGGDSFLLYVLGDSNGKKQEADSFFKDSEGQGLDTLH